jgi:transposase-like protein
MNKIRNTYSPEEKAAIVRRHLIDKVSVPQLCQELHLGPAVFYRWLKQLFDNAHVALGRKSTAVKGTDTLQPTIDPGPKPLTPSESREAEEKWMISLTQGSSTLNNLNARSVKHSANRTSTIY